MGRGRALVTQATIRRVIKEAKRAGAPGIEVKPDGGVVILFSPLRTEAAEPERKPDEEIVL